MSFEAEVLAHLDTINERLNTIDGSLKDIELKVSGVNGDPHNRGIFGALTEVTDEVDAIKKRQVRVTDEQTRQKAWLKGAAYGAGFAGATSVASLLKLSGAF